MKSITINQYFFYGDTCSEFSKHKTDERTRTIGFYKKSSDWSKEREVEFLSALPEQWAETHKSENFFGMSPASFDEWEENEGEEKHSHYAKIVISKSEANLYNSLLDLDAEEEGVLKAGYKEDTALARKTAEFDDGHSADISLCSGKTNFFCDPVLFNSYGSEVNVLDCSDTFDGTYEFEDNGEKYIVVVEVI